MGVSVRELGISDKHFPGNSIDLFLGYLQRPVYSDTLFLSIIVYVAFGVWTWLLAKLCEIGVGCPFKPYDF